jgi:hypothetical protein
LPTVLEFTKARGEGLHSVIESELRTSHRKRIVADIVRDTGLLNRFRQLGEVSSLFGEYVADALVCSPTGDESSFTAPSAAAALQSQRLELLAQVHRALVMHWPFVIQVIDDPRTPSTSAAELIDVIGAEANREVMIALALDLGPEHIGQVLLWTLQRIPEVFHALIARIREQSGLEQLAELCVESTFDHVAGLLRLLDDMAPDVAERLERRLGTPAWLPRFLAAGYRSTPSGWTALLDRPTLAEKCLSGIDERQWRYLWRSRAPEQPSWVRTLSIQFHRYGRADLQNAPAEHVVLTSRREDWHSGGVGLPHLDSTLRHSRSLDDHVTSEFICNSIGADWLDAEYREQTPWNIAQFLGSVWHWRSASVLATLVSKGLGRRFAIEERRPWGLPSLDENEGRLMLAGASTLVALPWRGLPLQARVAEGIIAQADARRDVLTPLDFLLWLGLRTVVTGSGLSLRLSIRETLQNQLRRWREAAPADIHVQRANRWMLDWIEDAASHRWSFRPDPQAIGEVKAKALG